MRFERRTGSAELMVLQCRNRRPIRRERQALAEQTAQEGAFAGASARTGFMSRFFSFFSCLAAFASCFVVVCFFRLVASILQ